MREKCAGTDQWHLRLQRVDGDDRGRSRNFWSPTDEALRMCGIGSIEPCLTHSDDIFDATMEHVGRCEQRQSRVLVIMVVSIEELGTPGARMLHIVEASGEIELVLRD